MKYLIFCLHILFSAVAFAQMQVAPATPQMEPPLPPPLEGEAELPLPQRPSPGGTVGAGTASSAPEEETIQSLLQPFNYQADSRRDPFEVYREVKPLESDFSGPLLPLQRYSLDEVRLVGILWDVRSPKAMFMDPMKNVHFLGKDDRIGRNNGYVAVIREGEVVVVEPTNVRGEMAFTTRVLRIVR